MNDESLAVDAVAAVGIAEENAEGICPVIVTKGKQRQKNASIKRIGQGLFMIITYALLAILGDIARFHSPEYQKPDSSDLFGMNKRHYPIVSDSPLSASHGLKSSTISLQASSPEPSKPVNHLEWQS